LEDVRAGLGRMKIQIWSEVATKREAWKKTDKGDVHPRTGHEGPLGEYRHSSTLSLTLALDGGGW